jgi:hypothetical protein
MKMAQNIGDFAAKVCRSVMKYLSFPKMELGQNI